jgi:hypothetical protein
LEGPQLLSAYYIVNAASGRVLAGPGYPIGAQVIQVQPTGNNYQKWNLVAAGKKRDEVVNAVSGLVLTDPSKKSGTPIAQHQIDAGLHQQWNLVRLGSGDYEVINAYSGLVLADPNDSTSNGTVIQQQK